MRYEIDMGWVGTALSFAERAALVAGQGEILAKPLRDLLLDALILTSPITSIVALLATSDPRWRERPKDWRSSRFIRSYARKWLARQAVLIAITGTCATLGVSALVAHLVGVF